MNKKGGLDTATIVFGLLFFVIVFVTLITAVGEISDNYNLHQNTTELADIFDDINVSQADIDALQNRYTDEAQLARGDDVNSDVEAVFRGIKVTGDVLDIAQDSSGAFQRIIGWVPPYVWGILFTVITLMITFAIYSDLRGK